MMKMTMSRCAAILALMYVAGCDPSATSADERADRASRSYTAAMAELQAGHVDAAISEFENGEIFYRQAQGDEDR